MKRIRLFFQLFLYLLKNDLKVYLRILPKFFLMISPVFLLVAPVAFLFSMLFASSIENQPEGAFIHLIAFRLVLLDFFILFSFLFLFILIEKAWRILNGYFILNNNTSINIKDLIQFIKDKEKN